MDVKKAEPADPAAQIISEMAGFCDRQVFEPGDALRRKGLHYHDMYILEAGEAAVDLEPGKSVPPITLGPGVPVGEMSFVRGIPATADVRALARTSVLRIDDRVLVAVEQANPDLAVRLLHWLAVVADHRSSQNLTLVEDAGISVDAEAVTVLMCRNEEMLTQAQQLRYQVYCGELGRTSPYADDERGVLADDLDGYADCFIAKVGDEVVGTLRLNRSAKGPVGIYEKLYGMDRSPLHPANTGVCTKFTVRRAHRKGPTAMKLVSAVVKYGHGEGVNECFIDCVPGLVHYYRAMGFEMTGERFFHVENGPSYPMMLDVKRFGTRLTREQGIANLLAIYLRSKLIKCIDRLSGRAGQYT